MRRRSSFLLAAALVVFSLLGVTVAGAAPSTKPKKRPVNHVLSLAGTAAFADQADCCKKATDAGKTCKHKCCVAAAKEGKECEKCGGKGDLKKADKTADKK